MVIFLHFLLFEIWFCALSRGHIDDSLYVHQILWVFYGFYWPEWHEQDVFGWYILPQLELAERLDIVLNTDLI